MGTLALVLSLIATPSVAAEPQPVAAEPEPIAVEAHGPSDTWAGEQKRVHWGLGLRAHVGLMHQQQVPFLLVESGLIVFVSARTFGHQEASIQFELSGGIPDTVAGETLITYRFHLSPRFSVGAGLILYWGFWSMRAGLEVPFAIRIGDSRRHELGIALRGTAGVYNNISYVWWDLEKQRFAVTFDAALTYAFLF